MLEKIFKNNATIAFYIAIGLCLLSLVSRNRLDIQSLFDKTPNKVSIEVYHQFQQELSEHEQEVWDLIRTTTQTTHAECIKKQKEEYSSYTESQKKYCNYQNAQCPKLKLDTIRLVKSVLYDFGIDPNNIAIVPFAGQGTPAAADDKAIFIDEVECAHYSPEACRFFIAHEISHIQAQDDSLYKSLGEVIKKKHSFKRKKKHAINAFSRFIETRADLTALLKGGKKYVKGAFDFLHTLQKLDGGDNPGITHPKTSERLANARKLCSLMGWQTPPAQVA